MLTLDTQGQELHKLNDNKESYHERRARDLAHDIETNTVTVANDDRFDVTSLMAQLGQPMTGEEIQRRLKLCNSRLHFIRSPQYPELTGIYLITDEWERDSKNNGYVKKMKHICGMESNVSPEFSVRHTTKIRKPNPELLGRKKIDREIDWIEVETFCNETRGWRTILIRLLHAKLINMQQINQHFPPPSRESANWYINTH